MQFSPAILLSVAAGGALGALGRYFTYQAFHASGRAEFPWGTLVANLVGCLLIGVFATLFAHRPPEISAWRGFVFAGFLGAFTTFSTFSYEALIIFQEKRFGTAATYLAVSLAGGLLAVGIGVWFARRLT